MAEWKVGFPVEYSSASDENIDSWVQKYIAEINRIYEFLGRLRRLDGSAVELTDTVAYQLRADYVTNKLLLRSADNTDWIELGKLEERFGHTPEYLGVVANHGNVPSMQMGPEMERPATEEENALYIAHDTKKNYRYSGGRWQLMNVVVPEDIVTEAKPGKLLRLDSEGKFPADLKGNADTATEADHAKIADEATHTLKADESNHALEADHAKNTDDSVHADEADHAKNAENAKYAITANEADVSKETVKLSVPVKINGIPFDGTRSITIGLVGGDQEAVNGYQQLLWRVAQNERELSNISLALEDMNIFPDYNNLLVENFTEGLDDVDMTIIVVTSVAAADNSLDVNDLTSIKVGNIYALTDGNKQEYVQVKAIIKNGSTKRVVLEEPLQNEYNPNSAALYRTTAAISEQSAIGTGTNQSYAWLPTTIWKGANASTEIILPISGDKDDFFIDGDIGFTADGAVTLL